MRLILFEFLERAVFVNQLSCQLKQCLLNFCVSCHLKCSDLVLGKLAFLCVNTPVCAHRKFIVIAAAPHVKTYSKLLNFVVEEDMNSMPYDVQFVGLRVPNAHNLILARALSSLQGCLSYLTLSTSMS